MKTEVRNKIINALNSAKTEKQLDEKLMSIGHLFPIHEKKETSFLVSCFNRKLNILRKEKDNG